MQTHFPTRTFLIARTLCAGFVAVALLGACAGKKLSNIIPDTSANVAEAMTLKREADVLYKDGEHLDAIEKYKAAIKKHPGFGEAWNNLGLALERDNNRYDAQQAYVRASELMPQDPKPMDNLGVLYMNTNLPEDALKYFEKALERVPQYLPSIRGAVRAAQLIDRSEESDLARIKMGLRLETDPKWRHLFQRQLARVQADLEDRDRNSPGFGSPRRNGKENQAVPTDAAPSEAGVVTPRDFE
jgi:tetratricopeptide (TPR) repeat protein